MLGSKFGENLWDNITVLGVCYGDNSRDFQKKIKDMLEENQ